MELICKSCNKEFVTQYKRANNFCSDNCRYTYHNSKKHIDRMTKSIYVNLNDLMEIAKQDSSLAEIALAGLTKADSELSLILNNQFQTKKDEL